MLPLEEFDGANDGVLQPRPLSVSGSFPTVAVLCCPAGGPPSDNRSWARYAEGKGTWVGLLGGSRSRCRLPGPRGAGPRLG